MSKVKGVHFAEREQRWVAKIYREGKPHHIGTYYTEGEAIDARRTAERILNNMQPKETAADRAATRKRDKVLNQIDNEWKDKTSIPKNFRRNI